MNSQTYREIDLKPHKHPSETKMDEYGYQGTIFVRVQTLSVRRIGGRQVIAQPIYVSRNSRTVPST